MPVFTTTPAPTTITTSQTTQTTEKVTVPTIETTQATVPSIATMQPTTSAITTTENIDCIEGSYYPNQLNCKEYYYCQNGTLYTLECSDGFVWDTNLKRCNNAELIDCGNTTTTANSVTTEVSTTTTPNPVSTTDSIQSTTMPPATSTTTDIITNVDCVDQVFYSNMQYCAALYVCYNRTMYGLICNNGLMWDTKLKACNYLIETNCGSRSTSMPVFTTTPVPTTITSAQTTQTTQKVTVPTTESTQATVPSIGTTQPIGESR